MNRLAFISAIILMLAGFYFSYTKKVEIIYFYDERCVISNMTDEIIDEIEAEFGDRVRIKRVNAFNPEGEDKVLVKRFDVKGVPVIVIDGRIYPYEYNYTILKNEVCKRFVFKPEKC